MRLRIFSVAALNVAAVTALVVVSVSAVRVGARVLRAWGSGNEAQEGQRFAKSASMDLAGILSLASDAAPRDKWLEPVDQTILLVTAPDRPETSQVVDQWRSVVARARALDRRVAIEIIAVGPDAKRLSSMVEPLIDPPYRLSLITNTEAFMSRLGVTVVPTVVVLDSKLRIVRVASGQSATTNLDWLLPNTLRIVGPSFRNSRDASDLSAGGQ